MISLWLLLAMSALLAVASALLYGAMQAAASVSGTKNGLSAQYAAESGAVWALEYIKENGFPEETLTVTLDLGEDAACRVVLRTDEDDGPVADLRGEKVSTGSLRYIQMTVETDETGVMVRSVTNKRETW